MIEVLSPPVQFVEPADPLITEIALKEAASLRADITRQAAALYGGDMARALTPLQERTSDVFFSEDGPMGALEPLLGRVVVDLGCGVSSPLQDWLFRRVSKYIGIDLFLGDRQEPAIDTPAGKMYLGDAVGETPSIFIEGDMLDTVSRLPDGSCSFVINGIDNLIVDSYGAYADLLIDEIHRVTGPRGYVMGVSRYPGILSVFGQRYSRKYILGERDIAAYRHTTYVKFG